MTQEELEAKCSHWKEILHLQDWTVEILFKKHFDATRSSCMAYIEVYEPKKHARINFIDPDHVDPEGWPAEDAEQSLVHELIHLHLWPFNPEEDTPQWTAMEQATHALTRTVIALDRKNEEAGIIEVTEEPSEDPMLGKVFKVPDGANIATWKPFE